MTQLYIHTRDQRTDSLIKVYSANMLLNAVKEVERRHWKDFQEEALRVSEYSEPLLSERLEEVKNKYPNFSQHAAYIEAAKQVREECYEQTGCRPLCREIEISTCELMSMDDPNESDAIINIQFIGRITAPANLSQLSKIWDEVQGQSV